MVGLCSGARASRSMTDQLTTSEVVGSARAAWSRHLGAPAPDDMRAQLGAGSIAIAAHETALRVPTAPALQIDEAALTHGELDERAARMAGWLCQRGFQSDAVVLLSAPSSLDLVVAYLGALRAGMTVLLANPAYTEAELDHLVADSGAVAALVAGDPL